MNTPADAVPVVLVGFMGAGKSTVGRLIAERLGRSFVDSDDVITRRTGRSPREIFAADGEAVFRAHERQVIADLVDGESVGEGVGEDGEGDGERDGDGKGDGERDGKDKGDGTTGGLVVALGGGAVEDPRTRALLRNARVVYLAVSYPEALARVGGDPHRPVLARPDLEAVHRQRIAGYRDAADVIVVTDGLPPEAVAERVLAELAGSRPGASSEHLVE